LISKTTPFVQSLMDETNLPGFSEFSSTNERYLANFGDEPSLSDRNKTERKIEDTLAVEEK
jgi:hypothetical protein